MKLSLGEIAALLGGVLDGPGGMQVSGLNDLSGAGPSDISFVQSKKHLDAAGASKAAAFLVPASFSVPGRPCIRVKNPKYSFIKLLAMATAGPSRPSGVHQSACVEPGADLAAGCSVGPFSVVESGASVAPGAVVGPCCFVGRGSSVGRNAVLHPNVTLYEGTTVGANTVIHSGSVIGADGFGYLQEGKRGEEDAKGAIERYVQLDEPHLKVPQLGRVVVGEDVEIGACVSIDRATIGETVVGRGTKIDNQVQVGHNTRIGEHVIIVAEVGIAGSVKIGNHVTIAGNCGIAEGADIGDFCIVGAHSLVYPGKKFPPRTVVFGNPARPAKKTLEQQTAIASLPRAILKIGELERRVAALEKP